MSTVNVNNTQDINNIPDSNSTAGAPSSDNSLGIVGSTSSLIAQLIQAYTKTSVINSALNVVDTRAQRSIGQAQADNITKAAKQKANSMRCQAIGGFVSGGLEIAGGVTSGVMGKLNSNAGEIENIKGYQDKVNEALKNPPGKVAGNSNLSKEVEESKPKAKARMNELNSTQDFKNRNIDADRGGITDRASIELSEEPELQSLKKHLDDLSMQKNQEQMSDKHQGLILTMARGSGEVGKGIASDVAASHDTKAGTAEADSSLEQTAASMMSNGAQEASKAAGKYADLASQIIETLVKLGEADVFRG